MFLIFVYSIFIVRVNAQENYRLNLNDQIISSSSSSTSEETSGKYFLPGGSPGMRTNSWDPSDTEFQGQITCEDGPEIKCLSLEEIIKGTLENGFTKRQEFENVVQARKRILIRLGDLLPKIEFEVGTVLTPGDMLNTFTNLFGFIVPSNWFNWAETKLFYHAQKESYTSILRNTITDTEIIYYNLHRVSFDLEIYNFYLTRLDRIIKKLEANVDEHDHQYVFTLDQLKQYYMEINSDAQYLNTVLGNFFNYDLALAMAYPKQEQLSIKPIKIPSLEEMKEIKIDAKELQHMKEISNMRRSLRYLWRAAHYSRLSRLFSFLTGDGDKETGPTMGVSVGLGHFADISIASSELRTLDVKVQEFDAKLESEYRKIADVINSSINLIKIYFNGKLINRKGLYAILSEYELNKNININDFIRNINWSLKFELNRNFVQHYYLIYKAQLNNLTQQGEFQSLVDPKIPGPIELTGWRNRWFSRENNDIDTDVQKGIFKIENP
jgi:hypothetical protein